MDLPNLFSAKSDKEDTVVVIFIHLTNIKIQSFLLSVSNDGINVLEQSDVSNYEGIDNCLIRTDESLQQLGKKSESIDSVIFGLNYSWIKKGEITQEKKPLLKKITDELSLKPMGFIVISEAIVQQRISRNSMFSGIVTILSDKNLTLTLVHQGKVKYVENVGRSADGKSDFLEGLARFSTKAEKDGLYLPTRIILASIDSEEAELRKHQQLIYDSDWKNQSQFLQPPTVEVMLKKEYEEMITKEAARAVALQKGMTQAAIVATVKNSDEINKEKKPTKLNSNDSGFNDVEIDKEHSKPTSFGIPISTTEFDKELNFSEKTNLKVPDFDEDNELAIVTDKSSTHKEANEKIHDKKDFKPDKKKKHYKNFKLYILVGFVTGLIALVIIAFFGIMFFTTAKVTVKLKTKPISKDLEITLDTSISETDVENLILAADTISKSKQSESTIQTTGVQIIGEKAKGRVSVYNNTVAEKTFKKGTVLTVGELQFELSDDVTIASASSPKPGITEHGKADVDAIALQIGADSNITKDTELTVVPFDKSSYYAYVIDEDFIGGASREVKVVSESDRLELLTDLRKEIVEEINKEFEAESSNSIYILPSNNIISENSEFSFEVGNEAEELSLILDIELEAITYTAADLKPIAVEVLDSEIPDNYKLSNTDPQILSAPTESDLDELDTDEATSLSANITSFAIPELSEDSIKDDISGKTIDDAKSLLVGKDEIESVEITLTPNIAKLFVKKIPRKLEKINVNLKE